MVDHKQAPGPQPERQEDLESTSTLLTLVQAGDSEARNRLLARYMPALRRWARGRLPQYARDLFETDDLVQETLIRAFKKVMDFEPQRTGAFWAYLRRILLNQIRDEIRRRKRRPPGVELPDDYPGYFPSPLEEVIGKERLESYEAALDQLTEQQREAVLLRVELGFNHNEIAEALGAPSPNAARMLVARGLARLAEVMHVHRTG